MKVLILSDVHAFYNAFLAVEKKEKTWDKLLFLGDAVDFGLEAHECVTWLREHDALCVMGNHDAGILHKIDGGATRGDPEKATSFAQQNIDTLSDEDIAYMRTWPEERVETIDGLTYLMMHIYQHEDGDGDAFAHQLADYKYITKGVAYWEKKVGPRTNYARGVLLTGDTHQCVISLLRDNLMFMNPGAMGYLLGEDYHFRGGHYIVVEDGKPEMRWVDYDTTEDYRILKTNAFEGYDKMAGCNQLEPWAVR